LPTSFADLEDALEWLGGHVDYERTAPTRRDHPTLEPVVRALDTLGRPQLDVPCVHVTGTNGKGSTTAITAALLADTGRRVGAFTSPDLHAVNERIAIGGQSISDEDLAAVLGRLRDYEHAAETRLTRFELLTVGALVHFADEAVDAAVIEVGVGGTWDATNAIDGAVGVVTNVALDHTEVLGATREEIARDKAGIVKSGAVAVLGDDDASIIKLQAAIARDAGASEVWRRDEELVLARNDVAVGGRLVSLRTPMGIHEDVFVSLHGAHQGANTLCAIAAVEAFDGVRFDDGVIDSVLSRISVPGRMEVISSRPLVILDSAHNPAGTSALADALVEEFHVDGTMTCVVGMLSNRDPASLLEPLAAAGITSFVCCTAPTPRALDPARIARAAEQLGLRAVVIDDVAHAVESALASSDDDDGVVVTGSFYVVGDARGHLMGLPAHRG
jgi:dihydrofolate synthase / folylpolyglutamate synthase